MGVPTWMVTQYRLKHDPAYQEAMAQSSQTSVEVVRGEDIFTGLDYPRNWSGFVGQEEAIEQLQVAVASAKARETRLDHILLASGYHGIGKSTLATLVTYKAGAGLCRASGPIDVDRAEVLLKKMQDGDVLFIDEIHSMGKAKAEWLLPYMLESRLYTPRGVVEVPDVTIIGATTDAGRLLQTMLSRFPIKPELVQYTPQEAAAIVVNLADRMQVTCLTPQQEIEIARASAGNPRDMRSILVAIRDLNLAFPDRDVSMKKALKWAGFSPDGLTKTARDMLMVLYLQQDHICSIDTLGAILGEPGPLKHHEQALLQRNMIRITGRGRQLTEDGVARALLLAEEFAA